MQFKTKFPMKTICQIFGALLIILDFLISFSLNAQCPNNIGQSPFVNTNGQIIYFPFNGNSASLGSGTYSATVSGATFTNGLCGQALQFDGVDDYLKITPFVPMTGNFTIASWIYINNMQNSLSIFATRDQCTTSYRGYSQAEFVINYYNSTSGSFPQQLNYNVNQHQNCTGYSGGDRYNAQNFTFSAGSWHFVAVTVQNNSSENRVVKFYIDCQLYSANQFLNMTSSAAFNSSNNNKSFIGASSQVPNYIYSFNGKIDEFRIFNRELSHAELLNLYYQCKPIGITVNKYLGNCSGDSANIELSNTQSGIQYQLFDSTNQQYIGNQQTGSCNSLLFSTGLVTSSTDFYIKATNISNGCQIVMDSLITLNPSSSSAIYYDTIAICENDSLQINGQYYFPPVIVRDTFVGASGCDSIIQTDLIAILLPNIDLGNDTSYCTGDSVEIKFNSSFSSVLWNTGEVNNSIYVKNPGTYWVKVNDGNCSNTDTIIISDIASYYINISDSSFCDGEKWVLNLPSSNQYLWFNGSSNSGVTIQDSGIYWVEITDICKTYTESFVANFTNCDCPIVVPNAFTPNGDGYNENFYAVVNCDLKTYKMYIFNRWGKLLFQSDNQFEAWDGKYKGKNVPEGVYVFRMEYSYFYPTEKEGVLMGTVTIYR